MLRNASVLFVAACALASAACDTPSANLLAPDGPSFADGVKKETSTKTSGDAAKKETSTTTTSGDAAKKETSTTTSGDAAKKETGSNAAPGTTTTTPTPSTPKTGTTTGSTGGSTGSTGSTSGLTTATSGAGTSYSVTQPTMPYELPVDRSLAASGKSWTAKDANDLRTALSSAVPGDEILLTPGVDYYGYFKLAAKTQTTGFITIRTNIPASSMPNGTTRVTAAMAKSLRFARIISSGRNDPAIDAMKGARGYRFVGVEIMASDTTKSLTTIVRLGDGSAATMAENPSDIILDRVYVHGNATAQVIRCVLANSARTAIINSTITECHAKGMDSNAIGVTTSPGPLLFENNSLQGAGMGIFIGGADPKVQNLIPSDVVIRGNHVWRPASWKGVWTVKNLLEFKLTRRALVEYNLFENNWVDGQAGMAINIKSVNQNGKAPWAQTSDITFRYNVIRNSPSGITVAAAPEQYPSLFTTRVKIENNLMYDIGTYNGTNSGRMLGFNGPLTDVQLLSNTFAFDANGGTHGAVIDATSKGTARGFIARRNIAPTGSVGWVGSGLAPGEATFVKLWGSTYDFSDNILVGTTTTKAPYPATTTFSTLAGIGFANPLSGNFSLLSSALGKAHGADIAALQKVLADVN